MAHSVHETVFLPPPQASGGGGAFSRRGKKRGMAGSSSSSMMANPLPAAVAMEESSTLALSGYACRFFEDESLARYVESDACFVPWKGNENLKIDRYDVRHLLDDLSFLSRKRRGRSPVPGDVDEELLDRERYFDLESQTEGVEPSSDSPEHFPEEDSSKRQRTENHRYAAIGFSYDTPQVPVRNTEEIEGMGGDGDEEERPPAASGSEAYVPPIPAPQHLRSRMPATDKQHQIMVHTAKFVSNPVTGGQAEIVLRVKHADNPNFGFLLPNHHLHPYFRHLVEIEKGKMMVEKGPQRNHAQEQGRGAGRGGATAISLLGATYGEDEDDSSEGDEPGMERQQTGGGLVSEGRKKNDRSIGSDEGSIGSDGGEVEEEEQEGKGKDEVKETCMSGEQGKVAGTMDEEDLEGEEGNEMVTVIPKEEKNQERKKYQVGDEGRVKVEGKWSEGEGKYLQLEGEDSRVHGQEEDMVMSRASDLADNIDSESEQVAEKAGKESFIPRDAADTTPKSTEARQGEQTEDVVKEGEVAPQTPVSSTHLAEDSAKANSCTVNPPEPRPSATGASRGSAGSRSAVQDSMVRGTEVQSAETAACEQNEPGPIIIPTSELLRRIIEKMVEYIVRNGKEFETIIRERDRMDGRFPFLIKGNEYHGFYLQRLDTVMQLKAKEAASQDSHSAETENSGEASAHHPSSKLSADPKGDGQSECATGETGAKIATSGVVEAGGTDSGDNQTSGRALVGAPPCRQQPVPAPEPADTQNPVEQQEGKEADDGKEELDKSAVKYAGVPNEAQPKEEDEERGLTLRGGSLEPLGLVEETHSVSELSEGLSPEAAAAAVAAVTRRGRVQMRNIFSDFDDVPSKGSISDWQMTHHTLDVTPEDAVPPCGNEEAALCELADVFSVRSPLHKVNERDPDLFGAGEVGTLKPQRTPGSPLSLGASINKKRENSPSTTAVEARGKRPELTVESVTSLVVAALARENDTEKTKRKAEEDRISGRLEKERDVEKSSQTIKEDSMMDAELCGELGANDGVVVAFSRSPNRLKWEADHQPTQSAHRNETPLTIEECTEDSGGLSADELAALVSAATSRNRRRAVFLREDSPKKPDFLFGSESIDGGRSIDYGAGRRRDNPNPDSDRPNVGDVPGAFDRKSIEPVSEVQETEPGGPGISTGLRKEDEKTEELAGEAEKNRSSQDIRTSDDCEIQMEMDDVKSGFTETIGGGLEVEALPHMEGIVKSPKEREGKHLSASLVVAVTSEEHAGKELPSVHSPVMADELKASSPVRQELMTSDISAAVPCAGTPSGSQSLCVEENSSMAPWSTVWDVQLNHVDTDGLDTKHRGPLLAEDIILSVMSSLRVQVFRKVGMEVDVGQHDGQFLRQVAGVGTTSPSSSQVDVGQHDGHSLRQVAGVGTTSPSSSQGTEGGVQVTSMDLEGTNEAKESDTKSPMLLSEQARVEEGTMDDESGLTNQGMSETSMVSLAEGCSEKASQGRASSSPIEQKGPKTLMIKYPVFSSLSPGSCREGSIGRVPPASEVCPQVTAQEDTGLSIGGDEALDYVLSDTSKGQTSAGAPANLATSPKEFVILATTKAKEAAVAVAGEADSADAAMSAQEKRRAERLKRAKAFAALLKGGLEKAACGSAELNNSVGLAGDMLRSPEKHAGGNSQATASGVNPLSMDGDLQRRSHSCSRIENLSERDSSVKQTVSSERDSPAVGGLQNPESANSGSQGGAEEREEELRCMLSRYYRKQLADNFLRAGAERDSAHGKQREGSSTRDEVNGIEVERLSDWGRKEKDIRGDVQEVAEGIEVETDTRIQEGEGQVLLVDWLNEGKRQSLHSVGEKGRLKETVRERGIERDVERDKWSKEKAREKCMPREREERERDEKKQRARKADIIRSPGRKQSRHKGRVNDLEDDFALGRERRHWHGDRKRRTDDSQDDVSLDHDRRHRRNDGKRETEYAEDDDLLSRDSRHKHKDRKRDSGQGIRMQNVEGSREKGRGKSNGSKREGR